MEKFDGFRKTGLDSEVEQDLVDHLERYNIDPLTALKLFPVLGRRQWLKRFLAHAELFKLTLDVPGDIAELGVFRGLSLMTWANLLEAYAIGNRTKTVYGFDTWEGFTDIDEKDGGTNEDAQKFVGGFSAEDHYEQLQDAIRIYDKDRFIPWKPRVKLVKGDISKTVPEFVKENPGVRFSLIHLDADLYEPTKVALENFWPLLTRGGLVLFDEYAIKDWAGESQAADEFFENLPGAKLKTLDWNNAPAAYLIKE